MSQDKGLESLQIWQKGMDFVKAIYAEVLPQLPEEEKWALASQLRRSSQSIPANIAEGYGRYYYQETIRFCYIARGSLEEAFSQMKLANEPGYLSDEKWEKMNDLVQELHRMLNGYIAYLKRSKRGQNEPGSRSTVREDIPVNDIYHERPDPGSLIPDPQLPMPIPFPLEKS